MAEQKFREHLKLNGLVGFGGKQITTFYDTDCNGGQHLKKSMGIVIKEWSKKITPETYEEYIKLKWEDKNTGQVSYNTPKSFYIKTGKDVGYIGIDFDTECAYTAFIKANPECDTYFTQKTKKGFHILFQYHDAFDNSCSNDAHEKEECKIDIRSNGGCLISYPTKYYHHDTGEEYAYEIYRAGEKGIITPKIIKYFDDNKIIRQKIKSDTNTRVNKKKQEIIKTINEKIEDAEEQLEEISSQSGTLFKKMCACYTKNRVVSYSTWIEMGCLLKNHFVNKGNEREGRECFKYFSQLKDIDGQMFYSKYNVEDILEKWGTMEVFKVKKVDRNKSWEKIKKWAKKDNEEIFNSIFDLNNLNLTSSYSDLKTAFEESNFKVRNPFCFCEVVDIDGQEEIVFRTPNELSGVYENMFWTKYEYKPPKNEGEEGVFEKEEREFVKDWKKDTELLTYERIDFRPYCMEDTTPDNIYNQFRGFNALKYYQEWKITPKRPATDTPDGIGMLLQHVKDLCGTPEFYEYFLDWLAFKIQFPARKNNIATIMKSIQGVGKDSFFDWFGNEILGSKYYLNIQGLNQLENFNALLSCKLLVVLNEFELKDSIGNYEKFKALITNVVNVINEKHEKQRKEKDYTNYTLLTNNIISFKIEAGQRRLTATEANNSIANNKEYFDEKYKYIYGRDKHGEYVGKDFIAPFFDFLMRRNVANKDWINTRVQTEYYKTLQDYSVSPLIRFFEYLYTIYHNHGKGYEGQTDVIQDDKSVFSASKFYTLFKRFRHDCNYKTADWNAVMFGTNLRHHTTDDEIDAIEPFKFITKHKQGINYYALDNEKMKRFLIGEGIIQETGKCLIKLPSEDGTDTEENTTDY